MQKYSRRVLLGGVAALTTTALVRQALSRALSPNEAGPQGVVSFPSCGSVSPATDRGVGPIRSVYVTVRDGVRIALDVTLPFDAANGERFPVVLIMTRYWRAEVGASPDAQQKFWCGRGFAVVSGDVRGTGASFGIWPYHRSPQETRDFGDIIDWISRQEWSSGRVIGWGNSYTANTADWMPVQQRSALAAVVSRFPDYDPYADLYFPGGVPNAYMSSTWGLASKNLDLNIREVDGRRSPGVRPVEGDVEALRQAIEARRSTPSVWEGLKEVTFRDDRPKSWHGASFDTWGIHAQTAAVEQSAVPMQSWASWMDAGTANGVLHRFMTLSNPQRAFIGPWSHAGKHDSDPLAAVDAPTQPTLDAQFAEDHCFVEREIRSPARAGTEGKLLTYYTLGADRWNTTPTWPLPNATPTAFYFLESFGLGSRPPQARTAADRYVVNFDATTGKQNRWATQNGAGDVVYGDRRAADELLLTYTSESLARHVEVTGHAIVTLHVASTHSDGAFFVYLEDVFPDGSVRYVTEGQLRGLHRKESASRPPYKVVGPYHSFKRKDAAPMPPGKIVKLQFALMPISALFRAGHRIRVSLAGADVDTFARIPAEGRPTWEVHRTRKHPSRIVLPVVR